MRYIYLILIMAYLPLEAQDFNRFIKQTAADRAAQDRLGMAVDISGGFALSGASLEDHDSNGGDSLIQAGSAYIFGRGFGGNWTQVQKLVASDRAANDRFGFSVSIDGERALIGATNKTEGSNNGQGAAYIFERQTNGNWAEVQKLTHPQGMALDNFGSSVKLKGDIAIVGAAFADPQGIKDAGQVFVFRRDSMGTWALHQALEASDKEIGDSFGSALDITGSQLAVGAWFAHNLQTSTNNDSDAGAVYIFEYDSLLDQWIENQIVVPDTLDWNGGDLFGGSLAITDSLLVVGADGDDTDEALQNILNSSGAVFVFEKDVNGQFQQTKKLVASDRETNGNFGQKIALSGDSLLVGAPGESEKVGGQDPNGLTFAGAAYLFVRNNSGNWEERQRIVAPDRESFDSFGFALAMTPTYLIISSNQDDEDESGKDSIPNAGSIYLVESCTLDDSVTQSGATLTANLPNANYQWVDCDLGNASIPGENGQSFTATVEGNYAVEITSKACYVTSSCFQLEPTSNELILEEEVLIYPNPSSAQFYIEIREGRGVEELRIFDLNGRMCRQKLYPGEHKIKVDGTEMAQGLYFLEIMTSQYTWRKKLWIN